MHSGDGVQNVSPDDAWQRLKAEHLSALVDVRTQAEWTFVGIPDLSSIDKNIVAAEWMTFPDNSIDPGFVVRVSAALEKRGIPKSAEIFFICRSGARSMSAAVAMTAAGYSKCRNVDDGFEGPADHQSQRGKVAGWKVSGLPWVQG